MNYEQPRSRRPRGGAKQRARNNKARARCPIGRNPSIDKKSRKLGRAERILIEKDYQLFWNSH